jgi:effector-binding domain-containing protein/uncharacterized protein YndB with AHSA1/START domain
MKIVKKIAIALGALVAVFVVVGAALPKTAQVERSIAIAAPPAMVFTVLNGFRQFGQWSPWADIDPKAATTFEGPEAGVGAKMSWAGNADVGTGSQEIVESTPNGSIKMRLTFGDFGGDFHATFTLVPAAEGTQVTWRFAADYGSNLVGRYFGLFSDRMLGPDYEKGLAQLKAFVEGLPRADFSGLGIETVEAPASPIVLVAARSANNANAIGVSLGVAYSRLSGFMNTQGLRQVAPPLAIYYRERNGVVDFEAAIPVDRTDVAPAGPVRTGYTRAGRAVKAVYRGPYAGLPAANLQVRAYLAAAGYRQDGPMWEQYVSDPASTPDADTVTHIYYPVK